MDADMWAKSRPCDLLLDIFRRLGSTAVIRCAGVCRPWRRPIIDNARCLRPRPNRFLPDLLLAFLDYNCRLRQHTTTLGRPEYDVPSAENVLALESVVDVGPYDLPLASRDGFLLLKVWDKTLRNSLCLCNLLAGGSCRSLSIAAVGKSLGQCSYVLATAYDDDSGLPDDAGGSVVYWLVDMLLFAADEEGDYRTCQFAMDTRTERTWTTELPEEYMNMDNPWDQLIPSTSEDGRRLSMSLVATKSLGVRHEIEVWVLAAGGSRWTLQRTMDVQSWLLPYWRNQGTIWLRGFWPRSGCLFAIATDKGGHRQQFLIGVDGSFPRLIETADYEFSYKLQYEMDWSTYISKMKYF